MAQTVTFFHGEQEVYLIWTYCNFPLLQ